MIKIKIKGELVVSYWPPKIGPLTPPPTFAVSSPGTGAWVLAHPRNDPRPSESPAPRRDICPLMRGDW